MSDKMRPIPFPKFMDWILTEYKEQKSIFGVDKIHFADPAKTLEIFGETIETPFGPAAGPHTQLCQNIAAAYAAGARFFELKTVQTLDGEDLPVSKPCIAAKDECYNVEWSTELRVPEAMDEYVKAWYALKLISREFGLGSPDGFVFNMSVGYDLAGIQSGKIDGFIEGLKNARDTVVWQECQSWAESNLARFEHIGPDYLAEISPRVCRSITLSTLHGCPPAEIERIATYLIQGKNLNTFIKCNPTMLGYTFARKTANELGFDYLVFDDHHFNEDLQFDDAVPMFRRLIALGDGKGLAFGVKLTNTFPVTIAAGELPGEEMYMSGRALFPLSLELANRLSREFAGKLRISFSGGADIWNITQIVDTGIWPVTVATTLLGPGGYGRLRQMAEKLSQLDYRPFRGVDPGALQALADDSHTNPHYRKPVKPLPARKLNGRVPLTDCFTAPCRGGCPIEQDIPAYLRLFGEEKYREALEVITERNPLPFITGTICPHHCGDKCTRSFYEKSVQIRDVKLAAANMGYGALMKNRAAPAQTGAKVAVVGGGPAGLAAAYFLAKAGQQVTVFEKRGSLGGIVRHVIPEFRIGADAIDKDIELVKAMGVRFALDKNITDIDDLRRDGFAFAVLAVGAWAPGSLRLQYGKAMNVIGFLAAAKADPESLTLGKNVAVIGGGNTAMDAARAARRVPGVESVSLVYRRSQRYMPADEEELVLAVEDGVEFRELLAPVGLKDGVLLCEKMSLGKPDKSGRRSPEPTGEMVNVPADTVIAAIGENIDAAFYEKNGVRVENGRPVVNPETLETEIPGVFAIGDGKSGPATVVEAIADAQRAANAIAAAHQNRYTTLNIGSNYAAAKAKKAILFPDISATTEPNRCLECATVCECCVDVCPNRANTALNVNGRVQIVHIDALCNECGNCETFCPYSSAPYRDKFTLFANAEDFKNSENNGFVPGGKARLDGAVIDAAKLPDDLMAIAKAAEKLRVES